MQLTISTYSSIGTYKYVTRSTYSRQVTTYKYLFCTYPIISTITLKINSVTITKVNFDVIQVKLSTENQVEKDAKITFPVEIKRWKIKFRDLFACLVFHTGSTATKCLRTVSFFLVVTSCNSVMSQIINVQLRLVKCTTSVPEYVPLFKSLFIL